MYLPLSPSSPSSQVGERRRQCSPSKPKAQALALEPAPAAPPGAAARAPPALPPPLQGGGGSPTHLVVLVNGVFGNAGNWSVMRRELAEQLDQEATLLHVSYVNQYFKVGKAHARCSCLLY